MRVLIADGDARQAAFLARALTEASFAVDIASDGQVVVEMSGLAPYDLLLLDANLHGLDGVGVCRLLRAEGVHVPILMLASTSRPEDRVRGLNAGADDYLTRPFGLAELSARMHALLRRGRAYTAPQLVVADLTLDPTRRSVERAGRSIELTPKEFSLLHYLMKNRHRVLTRVALAEHVWDMGWERQTNVIDVYVRRLRQKLDAAGTARLIHAVRGVGYVLSAPDDLAAGRRRPDDAEPVPPSFQPDDSR